MTSNMYMPVLAVAAEVNELGELLVAAIDAPSFADVLVLGMWADRAHAVHATINHRLVELGSEATNSSIVPVGAA